MDIYGNLISKICSTIDNPYIGNTDSYPLYWYFLRENNISDKTLTDAVDFSECKLIRGFMINDIEWDLRRNIKKDISKKSTWFIIKKNIKH